MAEKTSGYAGKIKNGAVQNIKAPSQTTDRKTGTVRRGSDLRTGSGK